MSQSTSLFGHKFIGYRVKEVLRNQNAWTEISYFVHALIINFCEAIKTFLHDILIILIHLLPGAIVDPGSGTN